MDASRRAQPERAMARVPVGLLGSSICQTAVVCHTARWAPSSTACAGGDRADPEHTLSPWPQRDTGSVPRPLAVACPLGQDGWAVAAGVLLVVTPRAAVAELAAGLGLSVLVTSAGAERLCPLLADPPTPGWPCAGSTSVPSSRCPRSCHLPKPTITMDTVNPVQNKVTN